MRQSKIKDERGAVMIEGVFGIFAAVIVMTFLLSFGFYLYQRTLIRIVANEIAEEIVVTYQFNKEIDDASKITKAQATKPGRYRYILFSGRLDTENEAKGQSIANSHLGKTSLAKAKNNAKVTIEKVGDDLGRMHYEVTLSQKYEFMLGDILSLVNLKDVETLKCTVYVDSVDISNYVNTVKFTNYGISKVTGAVPLLKMVNSIISLMNSVYSIFS